MAFVERLSYSVQSRYAGRLYRFEHWSKLCGSLVRAQPASFTGGKASCSGEMVSAGDRLRHASRTTRSLTFGVD